MFRFRDKLFMPSRSPFATQPSRETRGITHARVAGTVEGWVTVHATISWALGSVEFRGRIHRCWMVLSRPELPKDYILEETDFSEHWELGSAARRRDVLSAVESLNIYSCRGYRHGRVYEISHMTIVETINVLQLLFASDLRTTGSYRLSLLMCFIWLYHLIRMVLVSRMSRDCKYILHT